MACPFSVVAADLPGSGGEWPRGQAGSRHTGSAALMARECAPPRTLGTTDLGQARGFLLCFHCQCSWSLPCPSCRGGLALNGLREQLAKMTPDVCTFELLIPSRVLVIRHYLFGGACSDVERGKCLPRAMELPGSSARHTDTKQLPGLGTVAAVLWLLFTIGWQSLLVESGPFPTLELRNICQHCSSNYSSVLIPADILCFDRTCVCHCGALPMLVGLWLRAVFCVEGDGCGVCRGEAKGDWLG